MKADNTIQSHLKDFKNKVPMDKNNIKEVHKLLDENIEHLEIYTPPILSQDNLKLCRRYIREPGLNLEADLVNSETIVVKYAKP